MMPVPASRRHDWPAISKSSEAVLPPSAAHAPVGHRITAAHAEERSGAVGFIGKNPPGPCRRKSRRTSSRRRSARSAWPLTRLNFSGSMHSFSCFCPVQPAAGLGHARGPTPRRREAPLAMSATWAAMRDAMIPSRTSCASGRPRCSAGRDIAEEIGAGGAGDGAADGGCHVVVARGDVGDHRAQDVKRRPGADLLLQPDVHLDLLQGQVARALRP